MNRRDFLYFSSAFAAFPAIAAGNVIPAVLEYERSTGGHVGVYAQNMQTGFSLAWRANERFVMCSTFKASLAAFVLSQVDRQKASLETMVSYTAADILGDWWAPVARENLSKGSLSLRQMCAAAVEQSDNTCANLLLARIGGPRTLNAFWRRLGDNVTRLDAYEPALNRTPPGKAANTTTPAAMAAVLRRLALGDALSPSSRSLLVDWLVDSQTGFNRLRAGFPKSWRAGDKTGNNGTDAAGDLAITWPETDVPIIACVYTRGGSPTADQLTAVFSDVGRAVATTLYKQA